MTKLKTRKSVLKRIKITGQKKIFKRAIHQGHFNAKESGNQTRKKRKTAQLGPVNQRRIKKALPKI